MERYSGSFPRCRRWQRNSLYRLVASYAGGTLFGHMVASSVSLALTLSDRFTCPVRNSLSFFFFSTDTLVFSFFFFFFFFSDRPEGTCQGRRPLKLETLSSCGLLLPDRGRRTHFHRFVVHCLCLASALPLCLASSSPSDKNVHACTNIFPI